MENRFTLVQAEPPTNPIIQAEAEILGLLPGLRAEYHNRAFRCASCSSMKDPSWGAWVSDSVKKSDSREEIILWTRANAFNGTGSFWCLGCARSLGKPFLKKVFLDDSISFEAQNRLDEIEKARKAHMTNKHARALGKKRWEGVSPEKHKEIATSGGIARWKGVSKEDRIKAMADLLVKRAKKGT